MTDRATCDRCGLEAERMRRPDGELLDWHHVDPAAAKEAVGKAHPPEIKEEP